MQVGAAREVPLYFKPFPFIEALIDESSQDFTIGAAWFWQSDEAAHHGGTPTTT